MVDILKIANWLLPMLYLALLAGYAAAFFLRTGASGRSVLLPVVLAFHAGFLVLLARYLGRMVPATNYEVLSAMAAGIAAVYLVVEYSTRERRTGVFVLLAILILQYSSSVFLPPAELGPQPPAPVVSGYWSQLHTIPAMVAYVAFTISAIYSLLHQLALRDMRRHRFGLLFDRLPSLETLGKMNWHSLLVGFIFMTLAIVTGTALVAANRADLPVIDARTFIKILAGPAAWLIYAGAIVGKYAAKWDSARISRLSVAGFIVVLAMLVLSILLS